MQSDDSQNINHTPPPGPPKKGFWGFLASFFPKDHPMADSKPSSESNDPTQHATPGAPANSTPTDSGNNQQPSSSLSQPDQQQESATPISGAPDVDESQVPQTDEEGGPNANGEKTPPTVAAPQSVKAPAPEENEGNPETLPTEPEASGGSQNDDSTPDPGKPYDPKQK